MSLKLISLPLLFVTLNACYNVERDCSFHKTGTYSFNYSVDGQPQNSIFKRTSKFNIDYLDGKADTSSIRWINDCEFILTKIHPKNKTEEKAIHMKILSTTDTSYTFEYQLAVKEANKIQRVEQGEAIKIDL